MYNLKFITFAAIVSNLCLLWPMGWRLSLQLVHAIIVKWLDHKGSNTMDKSIDGFIIEGHYWDGRNFGRWGLVRSLEMFLNSILLLSHCHEVESCVLLGSSVLIFCLTTGREMMWLIPWTSQWWTVSSQTLPGSTPFWGIGRQTKGT